MFGLIPSTDIELLQLRIDGEKVTRLFLNLSGVLWWQRWWWWWWSWSWWWCSALLVIIIIILFFLLIATLSLLCLLRLWWLWTLEQTSEQRSRRRRLSGRRFACSNDCRLSLLTRRSATTEIARVGGHYAVQGHSRSLILVRIVSPYATY